MRPLSGRKGREFLQQMDVEARAQDSRLAHYDSGKGYYETNFCKVVTAEHRVVFLLTSPEQETTLIFRRIDLAWLLRNMEEAPPLPDDEPDDPGWGPEEGLLQDDD